MDMKKKEPKYEIERQDLKFQLKKTKEFLKWINLIKTQIINKFPEFENIEDLVTEIEKLI